ncbi:MAG: FkbM family methyltransferase [Bacteroidota bacterium]|nr:FkbM family methyltransferase [Bacteroidota bacterium]
MSIIAKVYRTLIPESLRWKVIHAKRNRVEEKIKKTVVSYYKQHPSSDVEINEALKFLQENSISVFPYPFFLKYANKPIEVNINTENNLPYVMHYGKKLYFKKNWTKEHIIDAYRFLLAEQDEQSGHCYLNKEYGIESNSVIVDVGAAEGIFALNEIEKIKHIYLIETDNEWIDVLKETYKPWMDKVTIINKFVSSIDDEMNVRLDTCFSDIEKVDFLKIDVDGAEQDLLDGADKTISDKVKKLAICTYHKTNDNRDFTSYLKLKKYSLKNSPGYMLFYFDSNFEAPYFRRGLIKAEKR